MKLIKTFEQFEQYKAELKDYTEFKTDVTVQPTDSEAAPTFKAEEMLGLSSVGNKVELPKNDKKED